MYLFRMLGLALIQDQQYARRYGEQRGSDADTDLGAAVVPIFFGDAWWCHCRCCLINNARILACAYKYVIRRRLHLI